MAPRELTRLGLWWGAAAGTLAGLGFVLGGRTLVGAYLVGLSLVGGAVARLVLPPKVSGGLVVRGRIVDVVTLVLLAVALFTAITLVDLRRR